MYITVFNHYSDRFCGGAICISKITVSKPSYLNDKYGYFSFVRTPHCTAVEAAAASLPSILLNV